MTGAAFGPGVEGLVIGPVDDPVEKLAAFRLNQHVGQINLDTIQ